MNNDFWTTTKYYNFLVGVKLIYAKEVFFAYLYTTLGTLGCFLKVWTVDSCLIKKVQGVQAWKLIFSGFTKFIEP